MNLTDVNKNKLKKYGIIAGVVLLTITIIITIINAVYCNSLKKALIGKSFEGSQYGFLDFEIGITFIDEEELTFDYYMSYEESILGPAGSTKKKYENVPYRIENGFFCIKIIIDEKSVGYNDGAEPYEFKNEGRLYTPNYDSGDSMYLYEV